MPVQAGFLLDFHLYITIGFSNANPDPVSVMVDINQAQFILCTLQAGKIPQQPLSLEFTEGEEVSFSIEGDGEVHLTGRKKMSFFLFHFCYSIYFSLALSVFDRQKYKNRPYHKKNTNSCTL